jgi:uncharacterized protein YndB with AHSA1/START domain
MATKTATGITITREFDAPRELVWKAWTDPDLFARWWGPKNFTAPSIKMDVRVGGTYHWSMRNEQDGQEYWTTGTFREVDPPAKLAYTDSFADADGNKVPGSHYGMDNVPMETDVTVTLEDLGGRTRMTLHHAGLTEDMGARDGWNESLDKLAASLK